MTITDDRRKAVTAVVIGVRRVGPAAVGVDHNGPVGGISAFAEGQRVIVGISRQQGAIHRCIFRGGHIHVGAQRGLILIYQYRSVIDCCDINIQCRTRTSIRRIGYFWDSTIPIGYRRKNVTAIRVNNDGSDTLQRCSITCGISDTTDNKTTDC